jgi:hypothetical protein
MQCIRRYHDAFLAGGAAAFTEQWVYPACAFEAGRWSGAADEVAGALAYAAELAARRERGVAGGRIVMLRVDPVSDAVALVHAVTTEERADGSLIREVETLYTTVRTAQGWRVAVRIAK